MASTANPLFGFFGHHKCASTWVEDNCYEVARLLGLRFKVVYEAKDVDFDLLSFVRDNNVQFITYANADYRYLKDLPNLRGFHVVRDPRDIVVSAYFSHRYSHPTHAWPELIAHREKLEAASLDEGLFLEMDFRDTQFQEMMSWPDTDDRIMLLKFEELTTNQYELYVRVFRHLGLLDESHFSTSKQFAALFSKILRNIERITSMPVPWAPKSIHPERLLGIVWQNNFSRKTGGRGRGEEEKTSHYRKGIAGDWKNYFNADHIAYFNSKYPDILAKYAYEDGNHC